MQVHTRLTYAWALKTKAAGELERIGDVCWHPRSGATARACGGCGAAVCIEKASSLQGVSEKYWARRATVPAAARRRLSADVATGDARKRTATGLRRQHRRLYSKNLECTWNSCGSKSVLARVQLRGVSVPCLVVSAVNWEMADPHSALAHRRHAVTYPHGTASPPSAGGVDQQSVTWGPVFDTADGTPTVRKSACDPTVSSPR